MAPRDLRGRPVCDPGVHNFWLRPVWIGIKRIGSDNLLVFGQHELS